MRVAAVGGPELVFEGQPVARVRRMSGGEVMLMEHPSRRGTTADGMSEALQLEEGDWRKGLTT